MLLLELVFDAGFLFCAALLIAAVLLAWMWLGVFNFRIGRE